MVIHLILQEWSSSTAIPGHIFYMRTHDSVPLREKQDTIVMTFWMPQYLHPNLDLSKFHFHFET